MEAPAKLRLAVLNEAGPEEGRVALVPAAVGQLVKDGFAVLVQADAGHAAGFPDSAYADAGAEIVPSAADALARAGAYVFVNPPKPETLMQLPEGALAAGFLYAYRNPELVEVIRRRNLAALALDAVPRTTRAQEMDALSSQANLAGYKAVILGASLLDRIFPLMMTAAGTLAPASVLVFGAGVAGLQAVATAKRLGARVSCTDVRPETREQVESVGGRFIDTTAGAQVESKGGYATEVTADVLARQQEVLAGHLAKADLVITTAQVFGRPAPRLITTAMLERMRPGAIVIDMAASTGGNVEGSAEGEDRLLGNGIRVLGRSGLAGTLPHHASQLYSKNLQALLQLAAPKGVPVQDWSDEILAAAKVK